MEERIKEYEHLRSDLDIKVSNDELVEAQKQAGNLTDYLQPRLVTRVFKTGSRRLQIALYSIVFSYLLSYFVFGLFYSAIHIKMGLPLNEAFRYFVGFGASHAWPAILGTLSVLFSILIVTKLRGSRRISVFLAVCLLSSALLPSLIFVLLHLFDEGGLLNLLAVTKHFHLDIIWSFVYGWVTSLMLPSLLGGIIAVITLIGVEAKDATKSSLLLSNEIESPFGSLSERRDDLV